MGSATSGSNAFALAYNSNATTATRTELGAWFDKTFALNSTSLMTLRTRAAWASSSYLTTPLRDVLVTCVVVVSLAPIGV
jgi:uncharacterized protein with beta-barrel porin domain